MPEYALILLALLITGFILHRLFKVHLYTSARHCLATNLLALIVLTIWDNFAIWRGHWSFGSQFLLGPKIGIIPIEEYLFVLIFPYFGLVVYKILESRLKVK